MIVRRSGPFCRPRGATAPEPVEPEDSATLMPYTLTSAGCLRANHSRAAIANTKGVIAL
jgi:hypothetical protein